MIPLIPLAAVATVVTPTSDAAFMEFSRPGRLGRDQGGGTEATRGWESVHAQAVGDGSKSALEWLIAPLQAPDFEREYYQRQPCLVQRHAPGYYEHLLRVQDLDTVLCTHAMSHPELSLVRSGDSVPSEQYTTGQTRIDPLAVARLFDDGATVIFTQVQRRIAPLARLCTSAGGMFGARVQTNVYLTPPNARGFDPHWDTHDVFVLQVFGRKHWVIHGTELALPLRGQAFCGGRCAAADRVEKEWDLGCGDALYIPRGCVHSATSTEKASLHVTVGIIATTWTDFFLEGVAATALEEEVLRQSLPIGFANGHLASNERERMYRERLDVLVSRLDPAALWRRYEEQLHAENSGPFEELLTPRVRGIDLTPRSAMRKRMDAVLVDVDGETDRCVMRFAGQTLTFPKRVLSALEFVLTSQEFEIGDLPNCLDMAGKMTLTTRLLKEGLLEEVAATSESCAK